MDVTKGTTCKKIPLYKPIEFDIALKLAINNKQKQFSLPDHQLAPNQIFFFFGL